MPADSSRRYGLHAPSGGDPADVPGDVLRLRDQIDDVMLGYGQGDLSARPNAGTRGRMYYATDVGTLYYDTRDAWVPAAWQPGDVRLSAAATSPPLGWLRTEGQSLRRSAFMPLFNAIGHTYNSGLEPSVGNFLLPDYRGLTLVGAGPIANQRYTSVSVRTIGSTWGRERHPLTVGELPAHRHAPGGLAQRFWTTSFSQQTGPPFALGTNLTDFFRLTVDYTGDTGGNEAHDNMQPSVGIYVWIKI